jgi:uncharacterized membrane protein YfcA
MTLSPAMTLGSFLVAVMVGLTGMGGGALLTPMLMLVFGVPPLAAVSSDLVVSAITKPVGALVHLRRRTVNLRLAGWLSIGSVPSAFAGGLIGWWLGPGSRVQFVTSHTTGVVLVIAAGGIAFRMFGMLTPRAQRASVGAASVGAAGAGAAGAGGAGAGAAGGAGAGGTGARRASDAGAVGGTGVGGAGAESQRGSPRGGVSRTGLEVQGQAARPLVVRKVPTVLIGIIVGLAVGITSTGSGTLVIAALTALYPALPPNRLVGTDLAQAVPMVLSAALAHIIAGNVVMSVTAPLLVGGIPGVIIGSLLASVAPGGALRPVLSLVILASGLSLLGVGPTALIVVLACVLVCGILLAIGLRRRNERRIAGRLAAGDMAGKDPAETRVEVSSSAINNSAAGRPPTSNPAASGPANNPEASPSAAHNPGPSASAASDENTRRDAAGLSLAHDSARPAERPPAAGRALRPGGAEHPPATELD